MQDHSIPQAQRDTGAYDDTTFDWELSHRSGIDQHEFFPDDVRRARVVLDEVAKNAGEIRVLSDAGIRTIVEGYIAVNTICLPRGHYRAEEGSEHFLFYEGAIPVTRPDHLK